MDQNTGNLFIMQMHSSLTMSESKRYYIKSAHPIVGFIIDRKALIQNFEFYSKMKEYVPHHEIMSFFYNNVNENLNLSSCVPANHLD